LPVHLGYGTEQTPDKREYGRMALCANDDETKQPVKFRLWVSRRMSRGDAEFSRRDDSRREWRHRRRPKADYRGAAHGG